MGSCLMDTEFQFCKMKRVLELGCTNNENVLHMNELHTEKWL